MKICVEMTEAEMNDFLQFRREKAGRTTAVGRLKDFAKNVLMTVGCTDDGFEIVDQDWAENLMEMAAMYAE